MPLRNGRPFAVQPRGLSDAVDGSSAFPGAMAQLANLVPASHTPGVHVPRPASTLVDAFAGFTTPAQVESLYVNGSRVYGMVQSARFAGKSEPFCYDLSSGFFISLTGVASATCPTQTVNTGEWTPPTVTRVGSRVLFTHPGFSGANFFGWLDMSGFTDAAKTGNTHTTTTVDTLSANVLLAGWSPGMTITDSSSDIPAGTRIVSIAADGLSLTMSAAATGSHAGTTFTVAGGTFAAPLWAAGNMNGSPLPSIPRAVEQFNGRAYFACDNALLFSNSGNPLIYNGSGSNALTFQNGLNITCMRGLPVTQTQGGILQALIAFQGAGAIQAITGDPAFNSLAINELIEGSGTLAPNSVRIVPQVGLAFVAPDGLRFVTFLGQVSNPVGANGSGVQQPFVNVITPSRMCAAYNEDAYRVSITSQVTTGGQILTQSQTLEYWYHPSLQTWSGPHSFASRLIAARQDGYAFIDAPASTIGLWTRSPLPQITSTYVENGTALTWNWQTCLLPDNGEMAENLVVQTTVAVAQAAGTSLSVFAADQSGAVLDTLTLIATGAVWGAFNWGASLWGGALRLQQRALNWNLPLVFKQMSLTLTGASSQSVAVGNLYLRYQTLGYKLQAVS